MIRRAILIEAANLKGQNPLPGAEADIRNYKRFLCSIRGGFWFETEIYSLSKPTKRHLLDEIQKAEKEADYLFLAFSGHGFMKRVGNNMYLPPTEKERTMLCINDTENISIAEINPTVKNFIIADSCRGIEEMEKAFAFVAAMTESVRKTTESQSRILFDAAVTSAEAGQIVAYSCGINEAAGEDKNRGGYFSAAMIECGREMSRSGIQRAISTKDVFDCAFRKVKTQAAQQNPEFSAGRRLRYFPFAVKI